jgi:hypothetical protein
VCTVLSAAGVPAVALMLGPGGVLRLVVENTGRAISTLREHGHKVTEHEVLVASIGADRTAAAGVLASVARAGIDIEYAYTGVSSALDQGMLLVLGVDDAVRAATAAGL